MYNFFITLEKCTYQDHEIIIPSQEFLIHSALHLWDKWSGSDTLDLGRSENKEIIIMFTQYQTELCALVNFHRNMKMMVQCCKELNLYTTQSQICLLWLYLFTVGFILMPCVFIAQRRFPTGVDSRTGKILKISCSVKQQKILLQTLRKSLVYKIENFRGNLSFADPHWQIIRFSR